MQLIIWVIIKYTTHNPIRHNLLFTIDIGEMNNI
jgi:hypothetical protein